MFEGLPYTNFHELNLDWIIKIAKDFLDQYTNIQQTITQGLEDLDTKAQQLQELLDAWYEEHSEDIANQLTDALQDLNDWYTEHSSDIADQLTSAISDFNTAADAKAAETIASIPDDYSALTTEVQQIENGLSYLPYLAQNKSHNLLIGNPTVKGKYFFNQTESSNPSYNYAIVPVVSGAFYKMRGVRFVASASDNYMDNADITLECIFQATATENVYVSYTSNQNVAYPVYFGNIIRVGGYNPESYYHNNSDIDYILSMLSLMTSNKNLFNTKLMVTQYCKINDQWLTGTGYSSYDTFIINATAGKTYKFGCDVRFLTVDDTQVGSSLPEGYEYTAAADCVMYCSINRNLLRAKAKCVELPNTLNSVNSAYYWSINETVLANEPGDSKNLIMTQYGATIGFQNQINKDVVDKIYGIGYMKTSGALSNGVSLTLRGTNNKKNNVYSFMTDITSFSKIIIGHAKNSYGGAWMEIDSSKVYIHNYFTSDSVVEYTHLLTISDYLYVQIYVKIGTADIKIMTESGEYTITDAVWHGYGYGTYFVESVNTTATNAVFTWASGDFRKPIWIFGDSYVDITNVNRWTNHLMQNGYADNVLINGYGGEASEIARDVLRNCIQFYGKPKKLIWCMGMNDGTDPDDTTPNTLYLTPLEDVIDICNEYDIDLVITTIPTVPSVNNEGKNYWIRNSNISYIDMASAVGADGSGSWYTGMLSNDNVHPTQKGAKAMYAAAVTECPDITYNNP